MVCKSKSLATSMNDTGNSWWGADQSMVDPGNSIIASEKWTVEPVLTMRLPNRVFGERRPGRLTRIRQSLTPIGGSPTPVQDSFVPARSSF
jgi:hypothetical protein